MYFKQFNPQKPAGWGILFRILATSIGRYIMSFDLHIGDRPGRNTDVISIVNRLFKPYCEHLDNDNQKDFGIFRLYADNWYTTAELI